MKSVKGRKDEELNREAIRPFGQREKEVKSQREKKGEVLECEE